MIWTQKERLMRGIQSFSYFNTGSILVYFAIVMTEGSISRFSIIANMLIGLGLAVFHTAQNEWKEEST